MIESKNKKINWGELMIGILFIILALLAFANPFEELVAITTAFAVMAIVRGVYSIIIGLSPSIMFLSIITGVINILAGTLLLFNRVTGAMIIPYIFAGWFIADSIVALFSLDVAKRIGKGYFWANLVANMLCILLGISLLFDPVSSAITFVFLVGFYAMLFGIRNLIGAFSTKF